jgi:hypothetical protein
MGPTEQALTVEIPMKSTWAQRGHRMARTRLLLNR